MKKKSNGVHRAGLNTCCFDQVDEVHYVSSDIVSPVNNDMIIKIVLVLAIMAAQITNIIDVKGFFYEEFTENEEPFYMKIPQASEK